MDELDYLKKKDARDQRLHNSINAAGVVCALFLLGVVAIVVMIAIS